ncbi:hypothetical protein [Cellulomonas oligotrophica]|uniref:Uncharacterized protein n=1 Tax=Cellulomonas oligotrophica TaxID=931536 RepID=A0A7Y9JZE0_9CELL|nr:hypothetical protein [Cellulomonas oligotrophica]NYD87767.1 hypothetical protein [Cellulomonas oligotrophica]GIG33028.1 hypothetical protein Col01nite_21870 [Cellulomonas oligotrophica]
MLNHRLDGVPVWAVLMKAPGDLPEDGTIEFVVTDRLTRVDGRVLYPAGARVEVTIGDTTAQDATIRSAVRAAWRAVDAAEQGDAFDGVAWDTWWDTKVVPAGVFTWFPAVDDPDVVQAGSLQVQVRERLGSRRGREYVIEPRLSHLDLPIPGVNLATVEVPPETAVPSPVYAKGIAGGVASLDAAGKVPMDQLPPDVGGVLGDGAVSTAELADAAVTPAKIAAGYELLTATQAAKVAALPSDAQSGAQVTAAVSAAIATVLATAPATLDTLNELATALGNDPAFAATMAAELAARASKADALGVRFKTSGGAWPPRPAGYVRVLSVGADPSPEDQDPGDLRMIPA